MKFGYAIQYVDDVERTIAFYERAFGLERGMVQPEYGELATGDTKLAFAAKAHVASFLPLAFQGNGLENAPPPMEIGLVTEDVKAAYERAVGAGAAPVMAPVAKPWGQIVGYVRDPNGFLVEICSPMK